MSEHAPLGAPGLDSSKMVWKDQPEGPGLYWVRYILDDGGRTQPVLVIVTPTGPIEIHALWAWSPNFDKANSHFSFVNYFVDALEKHEFSPVTDHVFFPGKGTKECRYSLTPEIIEGQDD